MPESGALTRELGERLTELGFAVRKYLLHNRDLSTDSKAVGFEGGDTIYAIDRKVEPVIEAIIDEWPNSLKPVLVIAEGFGKDGHRLFGSAAIPPRFKLLIDPIDGTRSLMYDKRSAWFLAAIAVDEGADTKLSNSLASVMVELPCSKQNAADSFVTSTEQPAEARRAHVDSQQTKSLLFAPSGETDLLHGFAQVSNFFPGTKLLAAELMERIVESTLGEVQFEQASVFEDQYISTGGQLVELLMGHDRFCCDLRPLFYDIIEKQSGAPILRGLECHPYDMAGLMVARSAGVILTDGLAQPLDAKFNVFDPVHWCGYANEQLRSQIEPVIQGWLHEKLG